LKFTTTTADTSIAAGEYLGFTQEFEGQDLQQLKKGSGDAESITLSFYVKGNASATYTVEMKDNDNDRINTQTFAVTTSWNRIKLTFAPDTTGTLDDDNASSLQISIWLHAGSDFTDGTFASNAWAARVSGNRVSPSATSIFDSTSRTFFITGIQMELGDTATPFEHRSYGTELALCQRYYYRVTGQVAGDYIAPNGYAISTTLAFGFVQFPVTMRTRPTAVEQSGTAADYKVIRCGLGTAADCSAVPTFDNAGLTSARMIFTVSSGLSNGIAGSIQANNTSAYLGLSAEL